MNLLLLSALALAPAPTPHAEAVATLEDALARVDGSAESLAEIDAAIGELRAHAPTLADDPDALLELSEARLIRARVFMAQGDDDAAAQAMDEAILSAMGTPLAADRFGPGLLQLFEERSELLEAGGAGVIEVDCDTPCELIINEHRSPSPSAPLHLGEYRVWVIDSKDPEAREQFSLTLDHEGEVETLHHAGPQRPEPPPPLAPEPSPVLQTPDRPSRLIPRLPELLGVAAGVGLLIVGGVLLAVDGQCENGAQPTSAEACPVVFGTSPQSHVLLGIGGALTLAGGVMLTIDEVRVGRARGHRAQLTWTLRF